MRAPKKCNIENSATDVVAGFLDLDSDGTPRGARMSAHPGHRAQGDSHKAEPAALTTAN